MIDEAGGGCLPIASGDGDNLGLGIAGGELNLGDNLDTFVLGLLDDRHLVWYARALDNTIGREDLTFCMLAFFPAYGSLGEFGFVSVFQGDLSERNTSQPCFFPRMAAPVPLSPPPRITNFISY